MEIVMIKHLNDMKTIYSLAFSFILLGAGMNANAQEFKNGKFDGKIDGVSSLPNNWEAVPHTDDVCYADEEHEATPDLTNQVGFSVVEGIRGNAKTGSSFVAGLDYGKGKHHEGIMQKLTGLKPGEKYSITFYQAVIKQYNALDTSGAWSVYQDNKLIAVTETSSSQLHYNDLNIAWEERTVEFTATKKNHWIKFMPTDDDNTYNYEGLDGNLRMGLDGVDVSEVIEEPEIDTTEIVDEPIDTTQNEIVEKDTTEIIDENVEIVKLPDTSKLDVIKLIAEKDPNTDSVHYVLKEPKEVLFSRPGPIDFKIVAEQDLSKFHTESAGAFRVVTKEYDYTLTITDMMGRVIMKKENCTHEEAVSLENDGHFLIIMKKGRYTAAKKVIVKT